MADSKISALTSQTGAGTDTTADLLVIVDTSAATTKKIIPDELAIAIGIPCATQAQMETATTSTATVRPSVQQFHPGHPKAWGFITPPTTVTASYPASGVSVVKNSTGNYTVTHGKTMSSANYVVIATIENSSLGPAVANYAVINTRSATAFGLLMADSSGTGFDPITFSYCVYGDT